MAGKYHALLGIPDESPDHYRLLGVDRFERNTDVISNAADRQMVYLRTLRNPDAEQLLNEVAAARVCLLDREKRAAYDLTLLGTPDECVLDVPLLENLELVPDDPVPARPESCRLDPILAEVVDEQPPRPAYRLAQGPGLIQRMDDAVPGCLNRIAEFFSSLPSGIDNCLRSLAGEGNDLVLRCLQGLALGLFIMVGSALGIWLLVSMLLE